MNTCGEWPSPEPWRIERALRAWRAAEEIILQNPSTAERRSDYDLSINTALQRLRSLATSEELLARHFRDRERPFGRGATEPGTVEACVAVAQSSVPRGQELIPALIEDAAF